MEQFILPGGSWQRLGKTATGRDLIGSSHPHRSHRLQCALVGEGLRRSDLWCQEAEAPR